MAKRTEIDGAALTSEYLDAVTRRGIRAGELLAHSDPSALLSGEPLLPRPLFLGYNEMADLGSDLELMRGALITLPDRLFGGDFAAYATAMGLSPDQAEAVVRSGGGQATMLARADLYQAKSGFHLLEFNMGSGVAGVDNADICQAHLTHPVMAEFARAHHLRHADTMSRLISLIYRETGVGSTSAPSVAITDWPDHYGRIGRALHKFARRWRGLGLEARACHVGQLTVRDGRVWLRGRPVDIIYRLFLLEHLLEPDGPALIGPLLDAASRGEVAIFTPLGSELYGSKAALAMLSDGANRHLFTPAEQAAIDRILPWTRRMTPGPVTLEDGSTVDLLDYATSHAHDLLLKPTLLHGGIGVLTGWHRDTTAQRWQAELARAAGGPYVIQRRVQPEPELFPDQDGRLVGWIPTWGVFAISSGFDGMWARAFRAESGQDVSRVGTGLHVTSCMFAGQGGL